MISTQNAHADFAIYRTGRSAQLDALARDQAILNDANETEMDADLAARVNHASLRDRGERIYFQNQYRRHTRNIADGNPFYS